MGKIKGWKKIKDTTEYVEWNKQRSTIRIGLAKIMGEWKATINIKDYSFPSRSKKKYVNIDESYTVANFPTKKEAIDLINAYMRGHPNG